MIIAYYCKFKDDWIHRSNPHKYYKVISFHYFMLNLCFQCKGRNFCKRGFCALRQKLQIQKNFNDHSKKEFLGENYNIFVGRFGYPNINVGLLNIDEPKKSEEVDNPHLWANGEYDINRVIQLRSNLINSYFKTQIKGFNDRFMDIVQELSLSNKPVDTEIVLEKKPEFKLTFSQEVTPFGPTIELKNARMTENSKIPKKVDSIVSDDLTAKEGLTILFSKGYDEHYLTKVLSLGNLGSDANKKMVPTRWSITAVDDTLGKQIITEIKDHPLLDYSIYFGGYLGNYYIILCVPEVWSYELFETLLSTKQSSHDYEGYFGRKQYAFETAGGYYAARFSVLQKLKSIKKQSRVIAFRFVTDDYWAPLGVWVVREAVKKAMNSKPVEFSSKEDMIKYANQLVWNSFNFHLDSLTGISNLLNDEQKKLLDF